MSKYGHRPHNWFEAIVNKLGGEEAAERFLRGGLVVSPASILWNETNGMITFSVTSDGTSGEEWIARLERKGFQVVQDAKRVLRLFAFKPTSGVTSQVVILKGDLFTNSDRITSQIRVKARDMNLLAPNAEVACLIRELLSNEEIKMMGLWHILAMHEPLNIAIDDPRILAANRNNGGSSLDAYSGHPRSDWNRGLGFAFVSQQVLKL